MNIFPQYEYYPQSINSANVTVLMGLVSKKIKCIYPFLYLHIS